MQKLSSVFSKSADVAKAMAGKVTACAQDKIGVPVSMMMARIRDGNIAGLVDVAARKVVKPVAKVARVAAPKMGAQPSGA